MVNIPILKINATAGEQLEKVSEEFTEVIDAVSDEEPIERILEECFDLIQATINFMYITAKHEVVQQAGESHFSKMRNRGHEINGLLKVSLE